MSRARGLIASFFVAMLFVGVAPSLGGVTLPPTRTVKLSNGATLILAVKRDVPLIAFSAYLAGGSLTDPQGKEGLASLTAEMLRRGAGKRNALQIAAAADGVGAELNTGAGLETSWISGEFLSRDEKLMIELLSDLLRRPSFPDSEFTKLKQQSMDAIRSEKDEPSNVLPDYAHAFFFGSHPYGRPVDGDERTLEAITREDVLASYRANYGGDRLILAVVGDFDAKRMEAALKAALDGWPHAPGPPPAIPAPKRTEGRRVLLIDKPDATQTYFWIGNLGIARSDPDRDAVDVANTAFGGRYTSMLNSELRTRTGLTYSARCFLGRPRQAGSLAIVTFTKTETTQEAIDLALETLSKFRAAGVDSSVLASVKSYVTGLFPYALETGDQIAGRLANLSFYGLPEAEVTGYSDRVRAVDRAQVNRVARRVYPDAKDLTLVLIGNASAIRSAAKRYGPVVEARFDEPTLTATRAALGRAR